MSESGPNMSLQNESIPPPEPRSSRSGKILEFDGLRGVLAVWVVFVHAFLLSGLTMRAQGGLPGFFARNLLRGQHAVFVFFILSGFVVTMQLERRRQSFGQFMTGRFFRIYPLYLIALGLSVGTVFLMPDVLAAGSWFQDARMATMHSVSFQERTHLHWHLLFHLLLMQAAVPNAWFPEAHWTILGTAWSLSHEWQFYLIAPRLKKAAGSPMGLILTATLAVLAARLAGRFHLGLDWSILATLPMFLIGIMTCRVHQSNAARPDLTMSQAMTPSCALLAFAVMANWKIQPILLWTIVYASVVAAGRFPEVSGTGVLLAISGFLKKRCILWLGKISYTIFLIHWPFMIVMLWVALRFRPGLTSAQAFGIFVATIPVMLGLCYVIHRTIETPFIEYGKRFRTQRASEVEKIPGSVQRTPSTTIG